MANPQQKFTIIYKSSARSVAIMILGDICMMLHPETTGKARLDKATRNKCERSLLRESVSGMEAVGNSSCVEEVRTNHHETVRDGIERGGGTDRRSSKHTCPSKTVYAKF